MMSDISPTRFGRFSAPPSRHSPYSEGRRCLYSEGVVSHSPGLRAERATLGNRSNDVCTPTGFRLAKDGRNPVGVEATQCWLSRGSRDARQPRAMSRNSFGVNPNTEWATLNHRFAT